MGSCGLSAWSCGLPRVRVDCRRGLMDVLSVMDRAYARRHELLGQPDVKWVSMLLNPLGVTLTIEKNDGNREMEFLSKEVASGC